MKNILLIYNVFNNQISEKISIFLIKEKLASCVFLIKNIQSVYIYKKKICKNFNYKILIKTKKKNINKVLNLLYFYNIYL